MKQILPFLFFLFLGNAVFAQSPGDFLFTGMYADTPDGFAIVVISSLPGSTNIYFTDDEWTGTSLNTTEGTVTWTTPAAGVVAGTLITFPNVSTSASGESTPVTASSGSPGTAIETGTMSISGANEAILAYVGSFQSPTTFIAAISNETISTNPGGLSLAGTDLDLATNTIEFELDEDSMTFDYINSPCAAPGMNAACVAAILDESNWITDLGSADLTDVNDQSTVSFLALPVQLTSFVGYAKDKATVLEWETENEVNNDYFSVQKSTDGKEFQEIAVEYGAGTTEETQRYSFVDERPYSGVNYYRLKQVDYDGQFAYSEIISVNFDREEIISIAPNPVRETLTISNQEVWNGEVELVVYSINGQVLQTVRYDNPDNRISLNVQDLDLGMYHIQITANNQVTTQRFVKN